jgi:hypothetical protein
VDERLRRGGEVWLVTNDDHGDVPPTWKLTLGGEESQDIWDGGDKAVTAAKK